MSEDLFQYSIRVSPKAKNPRLKVTLKHGLEVVIPKDYDTQKIPGMLKSKRHWIGEALGRVESYRSTVGSQSDWEIPETITLPAVGRKWHVKVRSVESKTVAVRGLSPDQLLIFGDMDDRRACWSALKRWLMRRARRELVPGLEAISNRSGLLYNRVYIRYQRTRWASCSKNRGIALNAKLLFLDPEIVRYVMIHELCHLEEMNHSKKFWSFVRFHLPDYLPLDKRLRESWKLLPRWVF